LAGTLRGEGGYEKTIWVYERGCGVPHEDGTWVTCETCNGVGFEIAPSNVASIFVRLWMSWPQRSHPRAMNVDQDKRIPATDVGRRTG
jgi:hypothetical protein